MRILTPEIALQELIDKGFVFENGNALIVNCSDVFYWGTADAEEFKRSEIMEVYDAYQKDGDLLKWSCKKRNMQPQRPIVESIKRSGYWDEEFEKLPKNVYENKRLLFLN